MPEHRHLRRLAVVWHRQPLYFITTCVAGRRNLLSTPEAHAILREEWGLWRESRGWSVGRYVIMPDHVHFFTAPQPEAAASLAFAIGKWKEWTAKGLLKASGTVAPFWQAEFFDHLLRSKESFARKWDYVRENPVRAGLVERAAEWPYAGWIDFR